jgi:putative transposase
MSFWRCNYHLVWSTKNRLPVISVQLEQTILTAIQAKSAELACSIFAMNTVADHIHIAASIPPKIAIAEWVRHVKGFSTREVNSRFPNLQQRFQWQEHYGVLTFGAQYVDLVTAYIDHQKEHHTNNTIDRYLEQTDERD